MARWLVLAVVVMGCGPAPVTSLCGVVLEEGTLPEADLRSAIRRALDGATFATDPALGDPTANCRAMEGFVVRTRPAPTFMDEGEEVFGATRCWAGEVVVGTPESGQWQFSGLVHEFFHVMQRCRTPMPIDAGRDAHHANWDRDLIFYGIGKGEDRPVN